MNDQNPATLPAFIAAITGSKVRSKTDMGATLELLDAYGMLPSPTAATRDYDAEAARMDR